MDERWAILASDNCREFDVPSGASIEQRNRTGTALENRNMDQSSVVDRDMETLALYCRVQAFELETVVAAAAAVAVAE
jgi:hypothetical protein